MKKYRLTENTKIINEKTLYQIQALVDIPSQGVKKGELGGFVESEENLSQDGNAWIRPSAAVMDNAKVYGNARIKGCLVSDNAEIFGDTRISYDIEPISFEGYIGGDVKIFGDVFIYHNYDFQIWGKEISGEVSLYQNHRLVIEENAVITGYTSISDNYGLSICGNAYINGYINKSFNLSLQDNIRLERGFIYGNPSISGNACICEYAGVHSDVEISGNSRIGGGVELYGRICFPDNADIDADNALFFVSHIGNGSGNLTIYHNQSGGISVELDDDIEVLDEAQFYFTTLDEFRDFYQKYYYKEQIAEFDAFVKVAEKRIVNRVKTEDE